MCIRDRAYGAEVVQLTVGPELFSTHLSLLEDTGYFNASLYTPFGIAGVETLGYELAMQCREKFGKDPEAVVCTNAGEMCIRDRWVSVSRQMQILLTPNMDGKN